MKPLKPSMKENKRYMRVRSEGINLKESVEKAILEFSGISGLSKSGLAFISYDKNSAVISVNREAVNNVRASLVVFPEKIEVKRISGTLRGLKAKE